ncbi:MAG: hypothetical protein NTU53_23060 [Planctomycetota bacterium]|nr:hypothetical protein [Planctomycetota bacterium]
MSNRIQELMEEVYGPAAPCDEALLSVKQYANEHGLLVFYMVIIGSEYQHIAYCAARNAVDAYAVALRRGVASVGDVVRSECMVI